MMKYRNTIKYLGLSALLLLAACSGSDPLEPTPGPGPEPEQQTAISFSGTMLDEESVTPNAQAAPATRAAQGLEEVLTGDKTFQVWGYKNDAATGSDYTSYQAVMPNFTVNWGANTAYTTTSNTDDWEYVGQGDTPEQQAEQTIKYWDFGAKAYRFFGYALGNATAAVHADPSDPSSAVVTPATSPATVSVPGGFPTGNSTPTSAETVTFSAAVDASSQASIAAAPYFSHLWFSNGNVAEYPTRQFGKPVQLEFLKPFARVRFLFTFVEGLSFGRESLKNMKFYPTRAGGTSPTIATAGTVSVSYPLKGNATTESWAVTPGTGASDHIDAFTIDYYETPGTVPTVNTQPTSWPNTPQKWYTVLPAPTQGSYTAEVCVLTEEVKSVVIPAEYMSWKAGYEYTYKFKITESGGITIDIVQVAINDWGNKKSSDHTVYNW